MQRLIIFLSLLLPLCASANNWVELGNGSGYVGAPQCPQQGPFFLIDPEYQCSANATAASKPGFREVIRWVEGGSEGECSFEYSIKNACGGSERIVAQEFWNQSEKYSVENKGKFTFYGFHVMAFEGKIYSEQAQPPHPEKPQRYQKVWCRSDQDAGLQIELLIESKSKSEGSFATVFLQDTNAASHEFEYKLQALLNLPIERQASTIEGVTYRNEDLNLKVRFTDEKTPQTKATLKFQKNGKQKNIELNCTAPR